MSQPPTQAQLNLAALAGSPSSPRTTRGLRKIQSHQHLSTGPSLSSQVSSARSSAGPDEISKPAQAQLDSPVRLRAHPRARSNSDASSREAPKLPTQRRPGRKTGSGFGLKRSLLEALLRDGPQQGKVQEALQELRYLVLSSRVDADNDGMVCAHLWLLNTTIASFLPAMADPLSLVNVPSLFMADPTRYSSPSHRSLPFPHP